MKISKKGNKFTFYCGWKNTTVFDEIEQFEELTVMYLNGQVVGHVPDNMREEFNTAFAKKSKLGIR